MYITRIQQDNMVYAIRFLIYSRRLQLIIQFSFFNMHFTKNWLQAYYVDYFNFAPENEGK